MTRKTDLSRVRYLRAKHASDLQKLATEQECHERILERSTGGFDLALTMDPTLKAVYMTTILRWLMHGAVRFEDVRTVRALLREFHACKRRLPVEQRDIGLYQSPGDLSIALHGMPDPIVSVVPPEIVAACPVEASGEGWAIFRVEDTQSAAWWGDSTSWCTRHPRTAQQYLDKGPLHVLMTKEDKWQLHVRQHQFMDRKDRPVTTLPSSVPDQAIEALAEIAMGTGGFFPVEMPHRLRTIIQKRRTGSAPTVSDAVKRAWMSRSRDAMVIPHRTKADGVEVVLNREDGTIELDSAFFGDDFSDIERDTMLLEFLRSGADRVLDKETTGLPVRVDHDNEIMQFILWSYIGARMPVAADLDGHRVIAWNVWRRHDDGEHRESMMHVIDLDAAPGSRFHLLRTAEDLEAASSIVRTIVSCIAQSGDILSVAGITGFDVLSERHLLHWRRPEGRAKMLEHLTSLRPVRSYRNAALAALFPEDKVAALSRLVSAVRTDPTEAFRIETPTPPTRADLEDVVDIGGTAMLMMAIDESQIDTDLVDRFMQNGMPEVLNFIPAPLLTLERLMLLFVASSAALNGGTSLRSRRILSMDAMKALDQANSMMRIAAHRPFLRGIRNYVAQYMTDNGEQHLRRIESWARRERIEVDGLDHPDADVRCEGLMRDARTLKRLEQKFAGVPLVAMPWPMALQTLKTSTAGLDELMHDLHNRLMRSSLRDAPDRRRLQGKLDALLAIAAASEARAASAEGRRA